MDDDRDLYDCDHRNRRPVASQSTHEADWCPDCGALSEQQGRAGDELWIKPTGTVPDGSGQRVCRRCGIECEVRHRVYGGV